MYTAEEIAEAGFQPGSIDHPQLPEVIVLNTGHPSYAGVDFRSWRRRGVRCVVDGRNFWSPAEATGAGLHYIAPGIATVAPADSVSLTL
jgi:hypothetical protein